MVQTTSQGTWLRWLQSKSSEKQSPWIAFWDTGEQSGLQTWKPSPSKKRGWSDWQRRLLDLILFYDVSRLTPTRLCGKRALGHSGGNRCCTETFVSKDGHAPFCSETRDPWQEKGWLLQWDWHLATSGREGESAIPKDNTQWLVCWMWRSREEHRGSGSPGEKHWWEASTSALNGEQKHQEQGRQVPEAKPRTLQG